MEIDEKLDISDYIKVVENFNKAITHMKNVEQEIKNNTFMDDKDFLYGFYRAAMIKIYETAIEASWKIMQRWIKLNMDNKIHEKPKRELFRQSHQVGLIEDPVIWWQFYEGRNKMAHTYHEDTAELVYTMAKDFEVPLNLFLEKLKDKV